MVDYFWFFLHACYACLQVLRLFWCPRDLCLYIYIYMWHSRRKSTFWRKNTKMSYLYHVVALTLLYLLVLVVLQSVLLFPSYKGKRVNQLAEKSAIKLIFNVSIHVCKLIKMGVVLLPTHILSQLLIQTCQ